LQGLLDRMQVRSQVNARVGDDLSEEGEEPALILDVTGDDLGILIGRRGETLRALQYMTRLMLSRRLERWEPIIVDIESYRVRRRRSLHQLADRMAERVAFSQQQVVLEAMPAHERRIIHIALRNNPQVTTKSIGEGDNRKVTITPR
jgi:spoIIIJ-associated protein